MNLDLGDPIEFEEEESDDMRPEPEAPRCRYCGHEISRTPIIRIFDPEDASAMWNCCEQCVVKWIS